MDKTVLIIGTLDTKGAEIGYLRDRLQTLGLQTIVVDDGILGEPLWITLSKDDITRAQAAKKRAEDALAGLKPEEDHDAYLRMEAALRRSNLRLDAVRRYRGVKDTYSDKDASLSPVIQPIKK